MPHAVLEGVPVLWHVAGERFGTNGEVDACPLQKIKVIRISSTHKLCTGSVKIARKEGRYKDKRERDTVIKQQ